MASGLFSGFLILESQELMEMDLLYSNHKQ